MSWSEGINQFSIFIGIWVAGYGIDAWRREHIGKRRIELAEDTLALFYEAKDAIRHIRNPMSFDHEISDIERQAGESDSAYRARKNASVVFARYRQNEELFNKIHAIRYRFMAQIGKDRANVFESLRSILNEITVAARMLAILWAKDHFRKDDQWEVHRGQVEKFEAVFWEGLQEQDPINTKLEALIAEAEEICKGVIEAKSSLHSIINFPVRWHSR